jgi:hypothetical protein
MALTFNDLQFNESTSRQAPCTSNLLHGLFLERQNLTSYCIGVDINRNFAVGFVQDEEENCNSDTCGGGKAALSGTINAASLS